MPISLALNSVAAGMALALVPVMWIVFNALLLYNVAVKSGRFEQFRQWMLDHLPDDRRLVLLVVAFSFGCLLEGISGFGTPIAITSALLIGLGFPALEALTFTLIFTRRPSRSVRWAFRSQCSALSRPCQRVRSGQWLGGSCLFLRSFYRSMLSEFTAAYDRLSNSGLRWWCQAGALHSLNSSRRTTRLSTY